MAGDHTSTLKSVYGQYLGVKNLLTLNNGGWRLKKDLPIFCVYYCGYSWVRKIKPECLYIECPGCLGRLPSREILLVSLEEYVILLTCIFIWSNESMLGEQLRHYLLRLFFFRRGAFCMVVLDTSVEVVWRTIVLGVLSFTFWQIW